MGDKEHHSEDYKLSAVLYYIENRDETNLRATCDIFNCKHQSLYRWVKKYEEDGELQRKVRNSKPLKITNEIKQFIKEELHHFQRKMRQKYYFFFSGNSGG